MKSHTGSGLPTVLECICSLIVQCGGNRFLFLFPPFYSAGVRGSGKEGYSTPSYNMLSIPSLPQETFNLSKYSKYTYFLLCKSPKSLFVTRGQPRSLYAKVILGSPPLEIVLLPKVALYSVLYILSLMIYPSYWP